MKKLLCLMAAVVVAMTVSAGNPLKLIKGKEHIKKLMTTDATATVVLDWSEASFGNIMSLEDGFLGEKEWVMKNCEIKFIKGFNEKSKSLKMTSNEEGARYRYVLKIDVIDSHFAPVFFVVQYEAKLWGKLRIEDVETNEVLVEYEIDEAEDGTDCVRRECYGETFRELGERLGELKK